MSDDETRAAVLRFDEAISRHDLDALRGFVNESPDAHFDIEDLFVAGDRAVLLWRHSWGEGHVRGVDLLRVRDGRVAGSLAYVKG